MFHIFIDTNIFREDPSRKRAEFLALSRLAKRDIVEINLPSIVDGEFTTQLENLYSEDVSLIEKGISKLLKKDIPESIDKELRRAIEQIRSIGMSLTQNILTDYSEWKFKNNVWVHDISESQARLAFKSYFSGEMPYSSIKQRKDIPDSFIYEFCKELAKKHEILYCICKDENLANALSSINNVSMFSSIGDFLQNSECKKILQNLDKIDVDFSQNRFEILERIKKQQASISEQLEANVAELLDQHPLEPFVYAGDVGDSMITRIHSLSVKEIDIYNSNYLGDGIVEIPIYMDLDADTLYGYSGDLSKEEKINPKKERYIMNNPFDNHYEIEERVKVIARSWFIFDFDHDLIKRALDDNSDFHNFKFHLDDVDEFEFIS